MLDGLIASMLRDTKLTPEQATRVTEAAAEVAARLGPLGLMLAMGALAKAKALMDAGDVDGARATVRALAEQHGVADLIDDLAAEMARDSA